MEQRLEQLEKQLEKEWNFLQMLDESAKRLKTKKAKEMFDLQLARWATLSRAIRFLKGEEEVF